MSQKKKPTKQQWIIFALSVLLIIFMWSRKELSAFSQLELHDALPMIMTSLLVSLLKIGIITLVVAVGKYVFIKYLNKK